MSESSLDPQYWTRQTEALRGVARAIVGDAALADDVAQAAWVTALSGSREARDHGWLRRVARSRAIDALRKRHAEPPASGLDPDACPAPQQAADVIAESFELQRALVDAVGELAEPYRSTVALVYFEGWSTGEVARLHTVPASTVRTRLVRAIERLRRRLSPELGDGHARAWSPGLVAFARGPLTPPPARPAPWLTPLSVTSTLAMNKLAIASVAAALALTAAWLLRSTGPAQPLTGETTGLTMGDATLDGEAPELKADEDQEQRASASVEEAAGTASEVASGPALVVEVTWHDGTPAAGVEVIARQSYRSVPSVHRYLVVADGEGRAVFDALPIGTLEVRTNRGGRDQEQEVEIADGEAAELALVVQRGLEVLGKVTDFAGTPVGGAEIWMCTQTGGWTQDALVATADPAGRFRVEHAPRGASFGARAGGYLKSSIVDLDELDRSVEPVELKLRLKPGGARLSGRVVDEAGEPVAGAIVVAGMVRGGYMTRADGSRIERWSAPRQTTGDDGRFAFVGLDKGELRVYARAGGGAPAVESLTLAEGDTREVTLTLSPGAILEGTLLGLDGQPVSDGAIRVFEAPLDESFLQSGQVDYDGAFGHAAARTDEAGRYRIEGVMTGSVTAYAMGPTPTRKNGLNRMPYVREPLELVPGEVHTWDVQLSEGLAIEGKVTYSDGTPITNIFVGVVPSSDGDFGNSRAINTDDGSFKFIQLLDEPYDLRAQIWELPEGEEEPLLLGVRPGGDAVTLVADFLPPVKTEPSIVRMRVSDPYEESMENLGAELQRRDGQFSWNTGTLKDGVWTFKVRNPGRYGPQVKRGDRIVWVGDEFDLVGGEDLDLGTVELPERATLQLRVQFPAGYQAGSVATRLKPEGTWSSEAVELSASAEHSLEGLMPGVYEVFLSGDGLTRGEQSAELLPGQTTTLEFAPQAAVQVACTIHREAPEVPMPLGVKVVDLATGEEVHGFDSKDGSRYRNPFITRAWLPLGRYALEVDRGDAGRRRVEFEVRSLEAADAPAAVVDYR